jgi:hypothetical protein
MRDQRSASTNVISIVVDIRKVSAETIFTDEPRLSRSGSMTAVQCNISKGDISINGSLMECNGMPEAIPTGLVQIFGSTTSNSISVQDSTVQVEFQSLSIQAPFTVSSSSLSVLFARSTTITTWQANPPQIQ